LDEWGDLTEYTWERYVHDNDGKAKFWELARAGKKTLSRSGSVGGNGNGRLRERDHLSEVAAKEWMTSQIKSKTKKGYKSPIEEEINLDEMLAQSSDDDSD
jgi:predicted DNA-binding WGR domain protein